MKTVCVITGGGSGMGFETARILGKENHIIICGRTVKKLQGAIEQLKSGGIEAEAYPCDVSDREAVRRLAAYAEKKGKIAAVIHAAGMSPHMDDAVKIMEANALGTIYVNEEFYNVMEAGSCIVDVASMAGYLLPSIVMPGEKLYRLSRTDRTAFMKKMMARVRLMPKKYHADIAYGISKNFAIWYAKTDAMKFGEKGIRVVSVSPGNFATPMGKLEEEEASSYLKYCAIKRFGDPKDIAELIAFVAGPKPGYLTGVDILMDGGCVSGKKLKAQD